MFAVKIETRILSFIAVLIALLICTTVYAQVPRPPFSSGSTSPLVVGTGDNQSVFPAATTTGQYVALTKGTSGAGDTTENPLLKSTRTITISSAGTLQGDGSTQLASIYGMAAGTSGNRVQPVGVLGGATNAGTASLGGNLNADAVGIYGVGRILTGGIGVGIGGFFQGRRDDSGGGVTGVEVQAANYSGVASTFNSSGFSRVTGIWLNANGDADGSAGLVISNPFSRKFLKGIAFTSQNGGGVTEDSVVDYATGQTSYSNIGNKSVAAFSDSSTSPYGFRFTGTYVSGVIETPANFSSNLAFGTTVVAGRRLNVTGGSATSGTNAIGIFGSSTTTHGSGTMSRSVGIQGQASVGSTSAVTTTSGVIANAATAAASTITEQNAFHAIANTNAGGAAITRSIGLKLDAQTLGTTPFQIYSEGTAKSYFAGSVHVEAPTTQVIAGGDTIAADACGSVKLISSASAVTTSLVNTFTAPSATVGTGNRGCGMKVCNVNTVNAITLDKNTAFFTLSAADVVLSANSCIDVVSDGTQWRQLTGVFTAT